ncbi:acetyl-CoA C-acetyltransferase [Hujiaoplasma nucleasis]|uniref:acetyl-CoA C-acetyltransferase n=1 Tax=Hujiaoplasma nucleasis TaxID=2725268 RepID=A0A7L6N4D1_9MOLU|nr:acetyl-CoA C-acetyltransferase [Hujiaoplasma nucleasis]QLY40098.1 acetyl-CoA C-acetyltransferase [Hujiaoplasma nucleasis]
MKKKVFIVGAKRSPIGAFLGSLKDVHPREMGAQVLKELLDETKVPVEKISEVIVGNILPANLGQGIARQISMTAGIPETVPAYSLNMVCGSGMKTMMNAYMGIQAGFSDIVVAGGVESMSGAPFLVDGSIRSGRKMGHMEMKDHMLYDALTDAFGDMHMGITAENIADKYQITREEQDAFAYESQQRAIKAIDQGKFKDEIVPIKIQTRKGQIIFDTDEYPNRSTTPEILGKLRTAFKKDGSVTAGSSSGINDGASFTIIASEEAVKKYNLNVLAEIVDIGQGGVDPNYMGMGPVPAIRHLLNNANMSLKDVDLIELNEAFASQSLGVIHELVEEHGVKKEDILNKTNVNGGAIALGHPVGVSGNRIVVTLIHEMIKRDLKTGLASLCIGGGMGTAILIKR